MHQDISKAAAWLSFGRRSRGVWALGYFAIMLLALLDPNVSIANPAVSTALLLGVLYVATAAIFTDYSIAYYLTRVMAWGSLSYFFFDYADPVGGGEALEIVFYVVLALFVAILAHTAVRLFYGASDPVRILRRASQLAAEAEAAAPPWSDDAYARLASLQDNRKIGSKAAGAALKATAFALAQLLAMPAAFFMLVYVEAQFHIPTVSLLTETDCVRPEPTDTEKWARWLDSTIGSELAEQVAPACVEQDPSTFQLLVAIVLVLLFVGVTVTAVGELFLSSSKLLYALLPNPVRRIRARRRRPVVYLRPFGMDGYAIVSNRSWLWLVGPMLYPLIVLFGAAWIGSSIIDRLIGGSWLEEIFPGLVEMLGALLFLWILGSFLLENAYLIFSWAGRSIKKKVGALEGDLGRVIGRFAEFVGIGDPREMGAWTFGTFAARAYFPDKNWREAAMILTEQAAAITVFVDGDPRSSGMKWEIEHILENDLLPKTVFVVPHDLGGSEVKALMKVLGRRDAEKIDFPKQPLAFHLDRNGDILVACSANGRQPDYELALFLTLGRTFGRRALEMAEA